MLLSEREEKKRKKGKKSGGGDYSRSYQAKAHESVLTAVLKMYQRLNMQMSRRLTLELTTVFNRRGVIIVGSYSSLLMAHMKMKNTHY